MATVNYSELVNTIAEFEAMRNKLAKMRCDCWGVYRLEGYERGGSQGTEYYHIADYATEQECLDYVQRLIDLQEYAKYDSYVVVPVTKNGSGEIHIGRKKATIRFKEYEGPCKVMLAYKKNTQRWFQAKSLSDGCESAIYASVNIIDEKPADWINESYDKHDLEPIWPKAK